MIKTIYKLRDIEVDEKNGTVLKNGELINLSGRAFDLLLSLLRANTNLLSHDDIMEQVWKGQVVNDETIKQNISRIRSAIGDSGLKPQYIVSVRGKGYKCIEPVSSYQKSSSEISVTTKKVTSLKSYFVKAMAGAFVLVIFIFIQFRDQPISIAEDIRLAVLPFSTLNQDNSDDYLAEGLTEEFISALAKTKGLKVLTKSAVLPFEKSNTSIGEMSNSLEIAVFVKGSIRKIDDRIRIYVQLINGKTQENYWSAEFDRPYDELFDIRQEVVDKISQTLFPNNKTINKVAIPTKVIGAYDDLLKGQAEYSRLTQDSNNKAIIFFQRASKRDPTYADAFAWLANAYAMKSKHTLDDIYAEKAILTVKEALSLDSTSFVANKALGIALSNLGRYQQAQTSSEKTLSMSSHYPAAINNLASVYMDTGQFALAADQYKQLIENYSQEIPYLALVHAHYAKNMLALGYIEIAALALKIAVELDPTHPNVMIVQNDFLVISGNLKQAKQRSDEYVEINQDCDYCLLIAADNLYLSEHFDKALEYYSQVYNNASVAQMSAASQIATIKMLNGDIAGANEILNAIEVEEQEYLQAGHEDWTHYLRLGDVSAIRQNIKQAHHWYLKAIASGYYFRSKFELDPLLAEFRKTPYFKEVVEMIETELNKQRNYIESNAIDKISLHL